MATDSKVVLITGASSGIGLHCALYLAEKGYQVYGTTRNPDKQQDKAKGFTFIKMDVDNDASVTTGVQEVLEKAGRIDVLVNNAGGGTAGALEDTGINEVKDTFETNFFGVHRVCKAVVPGMRKQGSGLVVQISSIAGQFGLPFRGVYSASKAAVEKYSESLRQEVAPYGVRVVLLEPGSIKTPINQNRSVAAEAQESTSAYKTVFDRVHDKIHEDVDGGLPPDAVAITLEKIIRKANPKVRYIVSAPLQKLAVALYHLLPYKIFQGILKSNYHLD